MWTNDILTKGYDVGTFKLGQLVYHIKNKRHMFKYKKECEYCDNTGKVNIKGKEFICLMVIGLVLCIMCMERVPTGHVGVVYNMNGGVLHD